MYSLQKLQFFWRAYLVLFFNKTSTFRESKGSLQWKFRDSC